MKKYIVGILLFFLSQTYALDLDELFSEYDRHDAPGGSVAVIRNGRIEIERAYGLRRLSTGERTTVNTHYRLASVSKQFTAMAVMILVDRGLLSLDSTITEIFPDFPSYGKNIKVRHLLNHTGGLKDYEDLIPSGQTEQITDTGVRELLMKQRSTLFIPGSKYQYSNGGYCMLSEIVSRVSGMPFARFSKENIFEPLGMENTLFFEKGLSTVKERAYGYSRRGSRFVETDQNITSATMGDGGVYTSVHDWVKWENALSNSLLVSPRLQVEAFTPGVLSDGSTTSYGFGWELGSFLGNTRHSHTGSTIGFRTAVQRFPEKRLTVVVLINRAESSPWDLATKIAESYLGVTD